MSWAILDIRGIGIGDNHRHLPIFRKKKKKRPGGGALLFLLIFFLQHFFNPWDACSALVARMAYFFDLRYGSARIVFYAFFKRRIGHGITNTNIHFFLRW
jgi:hypothetical protein